MNVRSKFFRRRGVTRIEVIATTAALALLFVVTAGMTRAEPAKTAACHNNLRQLGLALLSYADDNGGAFPSRRFPPFWPERLRPFYKDVALLVCPSDGPNPPSSGGIFATNVGDAAPRSYIMNGWDDYFYAHYGQSFTTNLFPESAISQPAQTILFGEKDAQSIHYWFDLAEGDDLIQVENGRHHRSGDNPASGASNHAFADGSVRLLKWGAAFDPIILWAVEPEYRGPFF